MKVLQINTVCGTGSIGRIEVDLYKMLKEQGHDCLIAYGRGTPPKDIQTIRIGNDWDIRRSGLKTRLTDREGFGSKRATKQFIEKVKKYDPDVIHLHNLHGYYINIEVLFNYLKEANKKVIWTLHDCWAFTGHCTHFDYIGCDKWKTGCEKCPQTREYPKSLLLDHSKLNYQTKKELFTKVKNLMIVTPSHWLADLAKESFLAEYPVEMIHNGIDLEVFKPTPSNFRERYHCEDKTIVLGVANVWSRRKGLNAFVQLSKELPKDFQIVLVGLSKKQIKKLPENIIKIERTNNIRELTKIYTVADVFVNPTLEEVLGMTNVEALACGTPVITYDTGGSPECIDEKCGRVVAKENIKELKKRIEDKIYIEKKYCLEKAKEFCESDISMKYYELQNKTI